MTKFKQLLLLIICSTLFGCGAWRENADKTLIWAHQAAKLQSQIAEPYFRLKCGKVTKNCKAEMVKAKKTCKTDAECAKACPALVTCQEERHAVNKAVIGVHLAVLSGRQLLVVGKETDVGKALITVVSVVAEMRSLSVKFGLLGTKTKTAAATQPTSKPAK
tara:strand:+ start:95 stop:580 length:486 start_codon:yes stop_codon:yes gene_type:complete